MSIDHKTHINSTILTYWFPDFTERVRSIPTPFKADIKFEIYLAETLPDIPDEIHHLEEHYLGKFSSHIGKILHILQYNRPDLM